MLENNLTFKKVPWRHDPRSRNFSHHALFGTLAPATFPPTLGRPLRNVENQKDSLRCTGYGTAMNGGYIHNRRFHPDWQAAKIGQLQGSSVDINGGDPNAAMRSERDCGFMPYENVPAGLSLEGNSIENTGWQAFDASLDKEALPEHVAGFVTVDGSNDTFDNIRSALVQAYDWKTGLGATVQAFGKWYTDWSFTRSGIVPTAYNETKYGYHHYLFVDFCEINGVPYLIVHNSGGSLMGLGGFQYMPREVVNREFQLSGFLYPSGTTLKIAKPLTAAQLELAAQESTMGLIERMILKAWYAISEIYLNPSTKLRTRRA